jgi:four helix bundle protein
MRCIGAMSVQSEQLKQRTMQFALDFLRLVDRFPRSTSGDLVGRQLAKSATSVAANYRATCVARSRAEFIAKLGVVFEETDESEFWLDVSLSRRLGNGTETDHLHKEAVELRGNLWPVARHGESQRKIFKSITR